ncbi:MAG: glycosyltransferase, partial [Sphingomonadaceae bacterium]
CDVLLVPAMDEPLGRTLVEAMLVRTPVVASNSGGNPEALSDGCGVLVQGDNPAAMAQAAHELLLDDIRVATMTNHASQSARMRFSSAAHVEAVQSVYHRLIRV